MSTKQRALGVSCEGVAMAVNMLLLPVNLGAGIAPGLTLPHSIPRYLGVQVQSTLLSSS